MQKVTIGDAELYLGDCREILPTLGRVDAVVTDPPYGIDLGGSYNSSNQAKTTDYGVCAWDAAPIDKNVIDSLRSCSDWQIIFGGNYFDVPPSRCWLVWDKQNTGERADCELAWTNLDSAVRRIYWRWNGMIKRGDDVREHPTQKPAGVMSWCIEQLPPGCQTILDPFAGSFTTGVAAVRLGKRFIGIEREPKYFEIGIRRIEQAYAQPDMFVAPPAKPVQVQML